ncbi:MAG: glycosyltransferase family 2 protein [candidate division Zixibacteria bacterium]|nr:glycosyltransferase family 2 protein [candidate division Zixibacteria bacterium]
MRRKKDIDISVVVPMFNEEENAKNTLDRLTRALDSIPKRWEIIVVDDGSTDRTKKLVKDYSHFNRWVKLISYPANQGRGKALRVGFAHAQGKIICTTDADLSYDEKYILQMIEVLDKNPDVDLVLGSPYTHGGKTQGVPLFRLLLSKWGNKILGFAMKGGLSTVTGVLRAYRKECISSLELESDGKEIHLEILSKALSMGYKAKELPATLKARTKGKSKFKFKATAVSHLIFSFFEKPIILFGAIGLFMLSLGFVGGTYIIYLWQRGTLNPNRPLMTLIVLLIVAGIQVLLFGFLGTQLVHLRKEIYKIQRENKTLEDKINNLPAKIEVEKKEVDYLPSGTPK